MDDEAVRSRPWQPPRTTIEMPIYSVGRYVPGSGPRPRISLAPPRDSTAYIIDKLVLQTDENMKATARRLAYYRIGFTDAPTVKMLLPCHQALDYVSPREMEEWEYRDSEKRAEEQARQLAETARAGPGKNKKKPGLPHKDWAEHVEGEGEAPGSADEALLLAQEAAGPSLSTPQKSRLRQFDEGTDGDSHTEFEDPDGQLRLPVEDESDGTDYEDPTDDDLESEDPLAMEDGGDDATLWRTRPWACARDASLGRASTPLDRVSKGSAPAAPAPASNAGSPESLHSAGARSSQQDPSTSRASLGARSASSQSMHSGVSRSSHGTPQPANASAPVPRHAHTFKAANGASNPSMRTSACLLHPAQSPVPAATTPATKRKTPSNGVDTPSTSEAQNQPPKKPRLQKKAAANPGEIWEVKDLLADDWIVQDGVRVHRYLVLWKGDWPPDQNPTWEPAENVLDRNLIRRYDKKKREGLLKPSQKAAQKKAPFSAQPWPAASKYSSVAEAFEAGIEDELTIVTAGGGGESDVDAYDEMLLVTDNAAELTVSGAMQAMSPMFRSLDGAAARHRPSLSQK
ncbi:hypothetical protein VTJ83DRAFT_792 [Remersonia thermophila]|uniref:Chromo domain-containing protein n=1 Tax=Remersonia thermophila TaxID=72144 RepID=A0ABR4DMJ3_9PEZI